MAYRSASRGIMYTAPPSGEEDDRDDRTDETTATAPEESANVSVETNERADEPNVEPTALDENTPTTDANWTGTVPADD